MTKQESFFNLLEQSQKTLIPYEGHRTTEEFIQKCVFANYNNLKKSHDCVI